MNYLKIFTENPNAVPEKYKSALTEKGMELGDDIIPFELVLEFFDYTKLVVIDSDGRVIASVA